MIDSEHLSYKINYDEDTPKHCTGRVIQGDKAEGWGKREFFSSKHKSTSTCQYLKDDSLFFQVVKL